MAKSKKPPKPFNPEEFRVKFKAFVAIIAILIGSGIMFLAIYSTTAQKSEHTGIILGFIMGTMLTGVLAYYFGNSDVTPEKRSVVDHLQNLPEPEPEPEPEEPEVDPAELKGDG